MHNEQNCSEEHAAAMDAIARLSGQLDRLEALIDANRPLVLVYGEAISAQATAAEISRLVSMQGGV